MSLIARFNPSGNDGGRTSRSRHYPALTTAAAGDADECRTFTMDGIASLHDHAAGLTPPVEPARWQDTRAVNISHQPNPVAASYDEPPLDYIEAGAGSPVILVHASMAGARQWAPLVSGLQNHFLVRAVNLFGYGGTPRWSKATPPSLDDYAALIARAVPDTARDVSLVGHSFGGAVAMQAAAHQLRGRVRRLVLIEPSLFYLLDHADRREAYREISMLASYTRQRISDGLPEVAAGRFIDYWCGIGSWRACSAETQARFTCRIAQLPHEWGAVLRGSLTPAAWAAALPSSTLLLSAADTTFPSRQVVDVLSQAAPHWTFATRHDGGHMAPMTQPHLVNPVIQRFLA